MTSIGEMLKKARERRRITYDVVQNAIKIHPKYIKALEEDDYSVFSGTVHSKGFLKLYSEFLGLEVAEVMALWRREYEGVLEEKDKETYVKQKPFQMPKITLTTGSFFIFIIVFLIFIFFGYLFYQYRHYGGDPKLDIIYPADNFVSENDILDITGKTDLDSRIYINGEEVILNPDGTFIASIKLKEGINTVSISSENRLMKKTEIIKTIIYRPIKIYESVESTQSSKSIDL